MSPIADQLNKLIAGNLYALLLVFARVGSALMLMPGFGSNFTPARLRLFLALGLSLVAAPLVRDSLPAEPQSAFALGILLGGEVVIGLFLGTISLLFMSVMETSGLFIAQQIGLSNSYIFNPTSSEQGSLPGTLLSLTAVVILFVTDLDHMLLLALVNSYQVFHVGNLAGFGDMTDSIAKLVGETFTLSLQLALPFMIVSLLLFFGFGLLGRLLPQIQVFFLTLPLQVGIGLSIFALTGPMMFRFWLNAYQAWFSNIGLVR
jgi:flagellar biosynthetic protein FliR